MKTDCVCCVQCNRKRSMSTRFSFSSRCSCCFSSSSSFLFRRPDARRSRRLPARSRQQKPAESIYCHELRQKLLQLSNCHRHRINNRQSIAMQLCCTMMTVNGFIVDLICRTRVTPRRLTYMFIMVW